MLDASPTITLATYGSDEVGCMEEGGSPTRWAADSGTGVGGGDKADLDIGRSAFFEC